MNDTLKEQLILTLTTEVVPALGCTEPIAVALAVAKAREVLGEIPELVTVLVSPNILKNGMGVGIPGTGMVGLHIAAALGAHFGKSTAGLQLLEGLSPDVVAKARLFCQSNKVVIDIKEGVDKLYIEALCQKGSQSASAFISGSHSHIYMVKRNNQIDEDFLKNNKHLASSSDHQLPTFTFAQIYDFATSVSFDEIKFILEGSEMNKRISEAGLAGDYGLNIGRHIMDRMDTNQIKCDLVNYALALTTAASDARMAGNTLPAMSNSGSGNQGIAAMLPVIAVAEKKNSTPEALARALVISNLLAIHIKSQMGRLSALCGVSVASAAASSGIVYLLGGSYLQMTFAVKNVIGNITGMICDGAKVGCSLKVSSGVFACVSAALMAIDNICIQDTDGIIDDDIENTLSNLAELGMKGMIETDKMILKQMLNKKVSL